MLSSLQRTRGGFDVEQVDSGKVEGVFHAKHGKASPVVASAIQVRRHRKHPRTYHGDLRTSEPLSLGVWSRW